MTKIFELLFNQFALLEYFLIFISGILAISIPRLFRKKLLVIITDTKRQAFFKKILQLLPSLLFLLFLITSQSFLTLYKPPSTIFTISKELAFAWFLTVCLVIVSHKKIAITLFLTVILPVITLKGFGVWGQLTMYLNQFAIQIGNFHLSLYNVLESTFIFSISLWLVKLVLNITEVRLASFDFINIANRNLLLKIQKIILYIVVFVVILKTLGIDLTTLTVFSGALGVGIGFGLQKISSNFISGIILLFEKTLEIDDLIELNDGTLGYIKRLGIRATLVEGFNGQEILIPNEDFITNRIVNWSYSDTTARVVIPIGVSYSSDLDLVQSLLLSAATEYSFTEKEPIPQCFLDEFADSSVNFRLVFWVKNVQKDGFAKPKSDVMFTIWNKFKQHNIEIPFPQRDITIKSS